MSRFFIDAQLELGVDLQLTEQVFHHWVKVLRAQVGDSATLFNGQGGEYQVTLSEINKKSAMQPTEGHGGFFGMYQRRDGHDHDIDCR